MRHKIIAGYC